MRRISEALEARWWLLALCVITALLVEALLTELRPAPSLSVALLEAPAGRGAAFAARLDVLRRHAPQMEAPARITIREGAADLIHVEAREAERDPRRLLKGFLAWALTQSRAQEEAELDDRLRALEAELKRAEGALAKASSAAAQPQPEPHAGATLRAYEAHYEGLISAREALRLERQAPGLRLRAEASPSIREASPSRRLHSLLLGFALGLWLIWLLERLDPRLRSPEGAAARLGLPVLGRLP